VNMTHNLNYDLMSNCYTAGPFVHILGWYRVFFLVNFDIDNCLKKITVSYLNLTVKCFELFFTVKVYK
jgi:hypothetical protein